MQTDVVLEALEQMAALVRGDSDLVFLWSEDFERCRAAYAARARVLDFGPEVGERATFDFGGVLVVEEPSKVVLREGTFEEVVALVDGIRARLGCESVLERLELCVPEDLVPELAKSLHASEQPRAALLN
jgi:hypothetical protein